MADNITFADIDNARRLLKLDEEAAIEDIKESYRRFAQMYHPDRCKDNKDECRRKMKEINRAKDILLSYARMCRVSFREKDVRRNLMNKDEYEHLKRFFDGWWGNVGF